MKDMGNWSELHLKEVTCYKILILEICNIKLEFAKKVIIQSQITITFYETDISYRSINLLCDAKVYENFLHGI